MFIRFFNSNQPAILIVLPLFAILGWTYFIIFSTPFEKVDEMPLFHFLYTVLTTDIIRNSLAFLLLITEAFLLSYIVNEHGLSNKHTYLPAFIYVILMSCGFDMMTLHPALCANLFLLLTINKLLHTYRQNTAFAQVFDAGFLISIASLFYLPSALFLTVAFFALIVIRPFIWREWIILGIGFCLPWLFIAVYYFWFDTTHVLLENILNQTIGLGLNYKLITGTRFFLIVLFILAAFSTFKALTTNINIKIKTKSSLWVLFIFLLTSIVPMLYNPQFSLTNLSMAFIPLSVFISNSFNSFKRNWIAEVLFLILFSSILWVFFHK